MRINRRTSGGRGEYEISGPYRPGVTSSSFSGRRFVLNLGADIQIDTRTTLAVQGGKPRLRMMPGCDIQLHLQLAAALLMPHPVREDKVLGGGAPVLQRNRYAIEQIDLSKVRMLGADTALLTIGEVIVRNNSYLSEELKFDERLQEVRSIWKNADKFPDSIADLIQHHEQLVRNGGPLSHQAEKLVYDLEAELAEASSDLGVFYGSHTDVLPALAQSLGSIVPEPPIEVDDVDPEEIEIKRRTIREWKRWAANRGASSSKFRDQVRKAYDATCLVCGLRFPPTAFNKNPGVDAAHILPWAKYDMDHVSNGLCLCKTHHWAFDEGLLVIKFVGGKYLVIVPDEIEDGLVGTPFSLAALKAHAGAVDAARLPKEKSKHPDPKFLEELRKDWA